MRQATPNVIGLGVARKGEKQVEEARKFRDAERSRK